MRRLLLGVSLLAWMLLFGQACPRVRAHEETDTAADPRAIGLIMPRLSADGKELVFSYQGALWRMLASGGSMTRLTTGPDYDLEPAWSPDGRKIAWIRSPSFGAGTLAVMDRNSGQPLALTNAPQAMDKLHFDRAGARILGVFQKDQRTVVGWYDLATGRLEEAVGAESWPGLPINAPGKMRQRIALSQDNRSLAVATSEDLPNEQTGNRGPRMTLWRVPLAGGPPTRIVEWPARIHDVGWRADDQAVFIVTERGGVHLDLWEVPIENPEDARQLTLGQADEMSPSVSHDGRTLAYTDNRHGPTHVVLRDLATNEEQIVAPTELDFGSPTGRLQLRARLQDGHAGVVARVVLRHADGKYHAPPGSLYRVYGNELHFYVDQHAELTLPAGEYTLKAWHGPEFVPVTRKLTIRENVTASETVDLARWTDQQADDWICGENHIHANYGYGHWYNLPRFVRQQCAGEDLTVANLMVANSDGDGVFDREFFLGHPDPLSTHDTILYWNEEFRSTIWGHMTLLNLKYLVVPIFTGFEHTSHPHDVPSNADIADQTHDQDGHVNYTHPAHNLQDPYSSAYSAKELPVDVALGKVDSIDIMGTGHVANLPLWYRMLNCGLRIPASAGTDCFLNRIVSNLPGADRVYVHCTQRSYQNWIDNLRAGRTFVTNGPMLRFTAQDHEAGSVIELDAPANVRVMGQAKARLPLKKLEVVVNGQVAHMLPVENPEQTTLEFDEEIPITQSGWIALRAEGLPSAFAHTSAIYVVVGGRRAASREDAQYFIDWIERLWGDVRARNRIPDRQLDQAYRQIQEALAFYRNMTLEEP